MAMAMVGARRARPRRDFADPRVRPGRPATPTALTPALVLDDQVVVLTGPGLAPVTRALSVLCPGWLPRDVGAAPTARVNVDKFEDGYRITGCGVDETTEDAGIAALWLLTAAMAAVVERRPGSMVLNAGALLRADGATVFAGESHAGKSSVALHLAAMEPPAILLGDDRVFVTMSHDAPAADSVGDDIGNGEPPLVRSTGLARKVRLPLPDDYSPAARAYATRRMMARHQGAAVLAFDPSVDRPAGSGAPLRRIVLLRRAAGSVTRTALGRAAATAGLLPLVGRHAGGPADLIAQISDLAERVPVHALTAPNSAALAAAMLEPGW